MTTPATVSELTNEACRLHEMIGYVPTDLKTAIADRKPASLNDIASFLNLVLLLEGETISEECRAMLDESATFLEKLVA